MFRCIKKVGAEVSKMKCFAADMSKILMTQKFCGRDFYPNQL
jgi:hypothetical protein